jgi:hypothetical protein
VGYQSTLNDHGHRHRDEDDVVDTRGMVDALAEHKRAEQDRHCPFQAGPQHEYSLSEVKLDRNQQTDPGTLDGPRE